MKTLNRKLSASVALLSSILVVIVYSPFNLLRPYVSTSLVATAVSQTPTPNKTPFPTTTANIPAAPPPEGDKMINVVVGGFIGVFGTLLGAVISYWLTLRRDAVIREEERKHELRRLIVDGAQTAAEKHGRSKVPFSSGDSLYYPSDFSKRKESLILSLRELLQSASGAKKESDAIELVEAFLERLRIYLQNDESYTPRP